MGRVQAAGLGMKKPDPLPFLENILLQIESFNYDLFKSVIFLCFFLLFLV